MVKKIKNVLGDQASWGLIGLVFLGVLLVLWAVIKHDREKPMGPQGLAAAAFNRILSVQEWKPGMGQPPLVYHPAALNRAVQEWRPGMGTRPFVYHPAGANQPVWRPLPRRNR